MPSSSGCARPIAVSIRWRCSPKSVGARTSSASVSLGGGLLWQLMPARQNRSPSPARSERMQALARFARRTGVKRKYKTRMRMPSKLDPHLATIESWLAAEPQITALTIVRRLAAIDPDTFGDMQHSIVQRLLKALRRKAAQRVIAETTAEGGKAKMPNAGVGGPAVGLRPPSGPPTPAPLQPHHQRSPPAAAGNIPP